MAPFPGWTELRQRYPGSWIDSLERSDVRGKAVNLHRELLVRRDLTAEERERHTDLPKKAEALLDELGRMGWLTARPSQHRCPICGEDLGENPPPDNCPNIHGERGPHAYDDEGDGGPIVIHPYHRPGIDRRDVGWLLALHGMNTRGEWQESFNWLVSTSYGRMVPVAIYKYGVVRPGVLSRWRQRMLMDRLVQRIERAGREVSKIIDDPRPDVIAHSFGTFLLGHALHRNPGLRVGRVITLGCILRPDFDWATLIERKQVDAVLNHYGTKDFWARMAHYAVPDGGPAGRRGFDFYEEAWPEEMRQVGSRRLFNVKAERLGHSAFFADRERASGLFHRTWNRVAGKKDPEGGMAGLFNDYWKPFLTTRDADDLAAALPSDWPAERWRQKRWPRRALFGGWRRAPHTVAKGHG